MAEIRIGKNVFKMHKISEELVTEEMIKNFIMKLKTIEIYK